MNTNHRRIKINVSWRWGLFFFLMSVVFSSCIDDFDVKKLHGVYRMMMDIMVKTVGKALENKADRTEEEDDMLDMMLTGSERVKAENLSALLEWYEGAKA